MRELKFRAWDKQTKDMLEFFAPSMEFYNKRLNRYRDFFDRHIIQMQYTGLKDKNGTEVYECDIVKGRYYDNFSRKEFDIVCIVRWDKSGYWTFDGRDKRFTGGYLTDIRDIEVVGNKYENPEWLEAKGNE